MVIHKGQHPNTLKILRAHFGDIPENELPNVAALVYVSPDSDVISTIFPTYRHIIIAGWQRCADEAIASERNPYKSLAVGYYVGDPEVGRVSLDKATYGGYVQVGEGFVFLDAIPADGKMIATINWNPDNVYPEWYDEVGSEPEAALYSGGDGLLMSFLDRLTQAKKHG